MDFSPPPLAPALRDLLRATERDLVRAIIRDGDFVDVARAALLGAATGRRDTAWLLVPLTAELVDALAVFEADLEDAEDDDPAEEGADLESDRADDEPSLGAPERHPSPHSYGVARWFSDSQALWADGSTSDREDDGDDLEPDVDGEPSISATEVIDQSAGWSLPQWISAPGR